MASPNVGGSSNDATGNTHLRSQLLKKIEKMYDQLDMLFDKLHEAEDPTQILSTISRTEREIQVLKNTVNRL